MREATYCKYCKEMITFLRTENGEWMPVNSMRVEFAEDPAGPDKVYYGDSRPAYGYILAERTEGSEPAYRPHWATCPNADQARRSKPQRPERSKSSGIRRGKTAATSSTGTISAAKSPCAPSDRRTAKPPIREQQTSADDKGSEWEQLSLFPSPRQRLKELNI